MLRSVRIWFKGHNESIPLGTCPQKSHECGFLKNSEILQEMIRNHP